MSAPRKPIRLNIPQSRVMRLLRDGITVVLAFGRGVGKSWFLRRIAYLLIAQWEYRERVTEGGTLRGVRVVFLLPSFKQFRDVHSRAMLDELRSEFGDLQAKVDRTTFTVTFPGGSSIQVFPASEHSGQRARGIRCDVVVLDEADDIDEVVFHEVVTPWFTEPWSLKIKIASGTPKRGRHGLLWKLFEAGRKGDRVRSGQLDGFAADELEALRNFYAVHATYVDAPGNVDQETVRLARVTMPKASFEREYLCSFDAGEGLVWQFDEAFHVREPPALETFREFHVGMDHGWVDPGVLLLFGVQGHGNDATLWLLDEWYETECPNHIWNERAVKWKFAKFWPDPSRPDRVADLRAAGIDVGEVDNDILAGVARVADLLFIREREFMGPAFQLISEKRARFYVSPKCKNTIREFGLYRRKKLQDGTFDEQPEDRDNHTADCARYVSLGRFGRMPNFRTEHAR